MFRKYQNPNKFQEQHFFSSFLVVSTGKNPLIEPQLSLLFLFFRPCINTGVNEIPGVGNHCIVCIVIGSIAAKGFDGAACAVFVYARSAEDFKGSFRR